MTEEFLHYLWEYRLFDATDLKTAAGEPLTVIKTGIHNRDAGPDFFDARVKIGEVLWAGNVEIHTEASLWDAHHHHTDQAYNNVILHVVYTNDAAIKSANQRPLPTLVLNNRIDPNLYERYVSFVSNKTVIPCEKQISRVAEPVKSMWLDRLAAERLERKAKRILSELTFHHNDWSEVFYISLAGNFGLKINAEPFSLLAKSLPYQILCKHKDNLIQLEALLFGQAGFLENPPADNSVFETEYYQNLRKEYLFLKTKYALKPIKKHLWKFMRMRPASFPTLRISQLAALIESTSSLFSAIIECKRTEELKNLFAVCATDFWDTHYTFDKTSSLKKRKYLGESTTNAIMINTVVPFLFLYGIQKDNEAYKERALKLLESLPSEKNSIVTYFEKLGFNNNSALVSQSLLELKNEYCTLKKCLQCSIGNSLLRNLK